LHPFYALVTDALGQRYQTDRINIRILPSIQLSISGPPFVLTWPAVPGISYDVFSSSNLVTGFQKAATVISPGLKAQWPVPAQSSNPNFFKVGVSP
jgi:hypothetical protein